MSTQPLFGCYSLEKYQLVSKHIVSTKGHLLLWIKFNDMKELTFFFIAFFSIQFKILSGDLKWKEQKYHYLWEKN